jgi:hypothetical protein
MRSGRNKLEQPGGLRPQQQQHPEGYSSSEDDEMTRLKPNSGTSTSGGSSSVGPKRQRTNYLPGHHNSHSEEATSPNESDNTYAEASLLHNPSSLRGAPPGPIRYGQYTTTIDVEQLCLAE